MAHFNDGKEVQVGDAVRLDGRDGTVSRIPSAESGNAAPVAVEVTVAAHLLEPVRGA